MKKYIIAAILLGSGMATAQQTQESYQDSFYNPDRPVLFGGAIALGFGNGFANIAVAPTALYQFTHQWAAGVGLQYNYIKNRDFFESNSYGVNLLGIYSPIPEVQLSAELEQLRVNNRVNYYYNDGTRHLEKQNFWNTALFLGAGYNTGNVTVGIRYNILFRENNFVYNQAWMPFVRVFF